MKISFIVLIFVTGFILGVCFEKQRAFIWSYLCKIKNSIKTWLSEIAYSVSCSLKYTKGSGITTYVNSTKRFNSKKYLKERLHQSGKECTFFRVLSKEYKYSFMESYNWVYHVEYW